MARMLALQRVGDETWDEVLAKVIKTAARPPSPVWVRFRKERHWKTDLWIRWIEAAEKAPPKV